MKYDRRKVRKALNELFEQTMKKDEFHIINDRLVRELSILTDKQAHQLAVGYVYLPRYYVPVVHSLGKNSLEHVYLELLAIAHQTDT